MTKVFNQSNLRECEDVVFSIQFRYSCNSVTGNDLADIYTKLQHVLKSPHASLADSSIPLLVKQLRLDRDNLITHHPDLIKAVIKHFNKTTELLDREQNREAITCKMLSILSIITQIIHNNPSYEMPFNRSFVQNLFMINTSLLENSQRRKDILRVMSVMFCQLVHRLSLLKELNLVSRFRQILLQSLRLIEDPNTFNRIYRCLCRVCVIVPLVMKQIVKYRVVEIHNEFQRREATRILSQLAVKASEVASIIVDPNIETVIKLPQT